MPLPSLNDSDMQALERLNEQDINAAIAGDVATITSPWTDDFVVIPSAVRSQGRTANVEIAERTRSKLKYGGSQYRIDFEEIKFWVSMRITWCTYRAQRGSVRMGRSSAGRETIAHPQRQADGSWKMHRTMTSVDPPA